MPRPAGADLRICDRAALVCTATSRHFPPEQFVYSAAFRSAEIPFRSQVKIGCHRVPLLHTLGVCRQAAERLSPVANAQNPDEKGWVLREGSL